ncbi:MAG: circularly permuted type 2 ATP-grasp protein [Rhodobacterales bacterium]|nr:circularly permuted type 2 ATP-grasp protein [Rhodobacterales bacterium]
MDAALRPPPDLPPLLAGYRPPPGASDELLDPQGRVRPVWRGLLAHLAGLDVADLAARFHRGDQYLRDAGVFFRAISENGSAERDWPFSHIPVLIDETDWAQIGVGLIQRADLLERVMADLYGPARLIAQGHLPPALVAENPEWLRPMVGVAPRGGHYLHFLAFEIGRGPDGTWWVLGDRTQAPSGAGFALENRVATTRVFSEFYPGARVQRLAGFFGAFRQALMDLRAEPDSRVGILTPGPLTDTYFEHAYIARYLGFMLLQGEDLTVEGGRLMVRTVAGLRPISVLWRRLDAAWADPLELDPASRLGTPGLIGALRQGSVTMVNALGSGVLETRALLAFLPAIARAMTGQDLILPNIATWWCGQAAERKHVAAHPERMVVSPALSTRQPFDEATVPLDPEDPGLGAWLARQGPRLVAQEAVTLSTTPAQIEGRLVPRPMSLRVFLLRTAQGWQIMPGGFARIGRTADPTAIAMQKGGAAADVWIVSDRPVATPTLLPATTAPYQRPRPGVLPSRAADNLFWLGRYVERAEGTMRLLRARNARLAEAGEGAAPLFAVVDPLLAGQGVDPAEGIPQGLLDTLGRATASAGQVRDRFSPDGWSALADLDKTAHRFATRVSPGDDAARALGKLLRKLSGFAGLVQDNMYRFLGWRFLELGRYIERAGAAAQWLAILADPDAPEGALDLAVEVGDSVMTHRRRFALTTSRDTVVDLLALDPANPRAIRFQVEGIHDQMRHLPGVDQDGPPADLHRAVLRLQTRLATSTPASLTTEVLWDTAARVAGLSDRLTEAWLR